MGKNERKKEGTNDEKPQEKWKLVLKIMLKILFNRAYSGYAILIFAGIFDFFLLFSSLSQKWAHETVWMETTCCVA